jgi:uncharacterized protein
MNRNFQQAQGVQRRTVSAELRTGTGDEFSLIGYAATYNSWSKNLGGFREQISPGAFKRSLEQKADVKALFNHAPDHILGRTRSGTLTLQDTPRGLRFRCQLDKNSQKHNDIYSAVKRGDISECSFAFTVADGGDSWTEGMDPDTNQRISFRTLSDVDLIDVSVVTYPAYNDTAADARSASRFSSSNLDHAIQQMRRFAQIATAQLQKAALEARNMSQEDFASLGGHMQIAHELCEAACAVSGTARDILDATDDEHEWEDDSFRSMNEAHKLQHAALSVACERCADTRLKHTAATKALGRKK